MRTKKSQLIGYFGTYFILGAITASLGPTLPALAKNLSVGIAAISILFTTRSFGYLVGSLMGGSLYDRFHGHRILALMLILSAFSLATVPHLGKIITLATIFFLIGISQGGIDIGTNILLVWSHKKNTGAYLNAIFFFAGVGSFATPLYLGQVSLTWGYRGIALFTLPIALWLLFSPAPQIPQHIEKKNIHLKNYKLFIAFALLTFIFIGTEASCGGWLFTYFSDSGLGNEKTAYTLTSLFWLAVVFGRLLAIPITARFKLDKIIIIYLLGATLSAGILFFRDYSLALWIGSIGMGASIATLFPSTYTYMQEKMQLSGKLTGIAWAAGSLGAMTLPWLIGQQIERVGAISMMQILLIVWILALGIFLYATNSAGSR